MKSLWNAIVLAAIVCIVAAGCMKDSTPTSAPAGKATGGQSSTLSTAQRDSTFDSDDDADDHDGDNDRDGDDGKDLNRRFSQGFVARIDNPFMPLEPGTVFVYRGEEDGEPQVDRIHVTHETKTILGVRCTVVKDSVFVGDQLVEATEDWFAQDARGNVWYFGENSREYDNGELVGTEGSWKAGKHGAKPGIVMEAQPQVGDTYFQERARDVAEDQAEVLALDVSVTVPYGQFANCLEIKEWTNLEPGVVENKDYARGVGMVKSEMVEGGSETLELVSVTTE